MHVSFVRSSIRLLFHLLFACMHAFLPIPWPACDDLHVARFMCRHGLTKSTFVIIIARAEATNMVITNLAFFRFDFHFCISYYMHGHNCRVLARNYAPSVLLDFHSYHELQNCFPHFPTNK